MSTYGVIYIANNYERDGHNVFKVGKSTKPDQRMSELSSASSNFGNFKLIAQFVVSDIDRAELECHQHLAEYRIQDNREFFKVEQHNIVRIVERVVSNYRAKDQIPKHDNEANPAYSAKHPDENRIIRCCNCGTQNRIKNYNSSAQFP